MDEFDIRDLKKTDAEAVARIHETCFEGYFLTQLGRSFLRRYYAAFCRHEFDYALLARHRRTKEEVAFVVGTSDTQAHFRSFYRRNVVVILPLVLARFLSCRELRERIWQRMAHVRVAVRALIPGTKRPASETIGDKGPRNQCPVRLLSIAVAPDYRGTGVAAALTERFEDKLREAGHKRVGLSVLPDNARAIAFYKKTGWELTHSSDAGCWFEKDL